MSEGNMQDNEPSIDWFNQEDESEDVGSLSDYISKHLQKRSSPELDGSGQNAQQSFWQHETLNPHYTAYPENTGRTLHHLDSQLVNSHLERYLPTPSTRYQMMRERLGKELEEIYSELNSYRHIKGHEYESKIQALEERASLLKRKIFELDRKISTLNPFQNMYRNLQKLAPKGPQNKAQKPKFTTTGLWTFIPNSHRQLREEVSAANEELRSLHHILQEQLHDPCFSPQMMGRLVNQYDAELKKAEKLMEQLRNRKSLMQHVGGWFQNLASHDETATDPA
jgi:hypothetical protein